MGILRHLKRLFAVAVAMSLSLVGIGVAAVAGSVTCTPRTLTNVKLSPGAPMGDYSIAGELCATRDELVAGRTVQLLIHGATYNHRYWDFGTFNGVGYDYARHVAAAGYPAFAIDSIGAGQSSHPPSALITIQAAGHVAHQVVQRLRNGTATGTRFGKVVMVGHSMGSVTAWQEAMDNGDVDGLVITGMIHHLGKGPLDALTNDISPAFLDSKFASSGYDPGYVTTKPGRRGGLFYNAADSDPAVIAADEAGKDVFSSLEFGGLTLMETTQTRKIEVPVLVVMGPDDFLCDSAYDCSSGDAIARQEAPYYSAAARLQACSVPNAGHDLTLHLNHSIEEDAVLAWANAMVGQAGETKAVAFPAECGFTESS